MSTPAEFLLQDCFWNLIDAGTPADNTALLSGIYEENPLAGILCLRFGISLKEAEFEISAARNEVQL